jgi:hypothetical protein
MNTCLPCHGREGLTFRFDAVRKIQNGEKVPVVSFNNGKVETWNGVVPVVKGKLDWIFLNRTEKGWKPVPAAEDPKM